MRIVGVEPRRPRGIRSGKHAAPLSARARSGVLHGSMSYVLQDDDGQIAEAHSISAGLDYPGVGPEHAWLQGHRAAPSTSSVTDAGGARGASRLLTRLEGIMPALESAHAVAHACGSPRTLPREARW